MHPRGRDIPPLLVGWYDGYSLDTKPPIRRKLCLQPSLHQTPSTSHPAKRPYVIAASEAGIVCVKPDDQETPNATTWEQWGDVVEGHNNHTRQAVRELEEYFAGERKTFTVPLDMRGTDFQKRAWEALTGIPYGETRSYGQQAAMLGNPHAGRAVGLANGSNPVSIIVPCHRVVGSNGKLTGYGGGLHRKQALLDLERRNHRLI